MFMKRSMLLTIFPSLKLTTIIRLKFYYWFIRLFICFFVSY